MDNRLSLILISVYVAVSGCQETILSAAEEKAPFGDMSAIVNTGEYNAPVSAPKKSDSKTRLVVNSGYGKDAFSQDVIQCNNEGDVLYVNLSNEGIRYMQEGRFGDAAAALKKAITIRRDLPHAYVNLADAYYHLGRYEESIAVSKIALSISPANANSYGNLGNAYNALGNEADAVENFKKALELFRKEGNAAAVKKTEESISNIRINKP